MYFRKYFRIISLVLITLVEISFAGVFSSRVEYVIGDVTYQKGGKGERTRIRVGQRIRPTDRVRTQINETVGIVFPNGSKIFILEESLVDQSELLVKDENIQVLIEIKSGKLGFNVQKNTYSQNVFKFKFGTAMAIVNESCGIAGITFEGKHYLSVAKGVVELNQGDTTISVSAGQTVISDDKNNFLVINLESSGDAAFLNGLEPIFENSSITSDSLTKLLLSKDIQYKILLDSLKNEDRQYEKLLYCPRICCN